VKCSPYGEAVSAEARKHADEIKAKLTRAFTSSSKARSWTTRAKNRDRTGTDRGQKDPNLNKMDYLVEGVIGATS